MTTWTFATSSSRAGELRSAVVTHHGMMSLRVIDVDPLSFLERICDRVFRGAEEWEEQHKESERTIVRRDIASLFAEADEIAKAFGRTREDRLEELLFAALDPLEHKYDAWEDPEHRLYDIHRGAPATPNVAGSRP